MITLLHGPMSALFILLMLSFASITTAEFGIPKSDTVTAEGLINEESENLTTLTEDDAHKIAALVEAAKEDPESLRLIESLKKENSETLDELRKLPVEEIFDGLKISLNELSILDNFFSDNERAVEEMHKEGLIPEEHMKKYKENPALLEEDTRQGLYFQFISLAVVGGYL